MSKKRNSRPREDKPEDKPNPSWSTRFKPGQSGNPLGRPKGSRNMATLIEEELDLKMTLTEEGQQKMLSKRQVLAKTMVNRAIKNGETKMISLIIALVGRDAVEEDAPLSDVEATMVANFLKRYGTKEGSDDE